MTNKVTEAKKAAEANLIVRREETAAIHRRRAVMLFRRRKSVANFGRQFRFNFREKSREAHGPVYAALLLDSGDGEMRKWPSLLTSSKRIDIRLDTPDCSIVTPYRMSPTCIERLLCVIMMN